MGDFRFRPFQDTMDFLKGDITFAEVAAGRRFITDEARQKYCTKYKFDDVRKK